MFLGLSPSFLCTSQPQDPTSGSVAASPTRRGRAEKGKEKRIKKREIFPLSLSLFALFASPRLTIAAALLFFFLRQPFLAFPRSRRPFRGLDIAPTGATQSLSQAPRQRKGARRGIGSVAEASHLALPCRPSMQSINRSKKKTLGLIFPPAFPRLGPPFPLLFRSQTHVYRFM